MKWTVFWHLLGLAVAVEQLQFMEEWTLWKTEHQRRYSGEREELERHSVWLTNREFVLKHNAQWESHGYSLSLNQFADLVSLGRERERERIPSMFYRQMKNM